MSPALLLPSHLRALTMSFQASFPAPGEPIFFPDQDREWGTWTYFSPPSVRQPLAESLVPKVSDASPVRCFSRDLEPMLTYSLFVVALLLTTLQEYGGEVFPPRKLSYFACP